MMERDDSNIYGESPDPRFPVERAAAAAIDAAEVALNREGGELRKMFVLLYADGVGEPNCTTSGTGYDDAVDMLSELFAHFKLSMEQLGGEVHIAPLRKG